MKKYLLGLFIIFFLFVIQNSAYSDDNSYFEGYTIENLNPPLEKLTGGQLYGAIHVFIREKRYKEAIELSEKMIKEYPYIPQGYILLARAKEKLGDTSDLEAIYTKCIAEEPEDERAYIYRAIIRYKEKRYKEAIQDYDVLLKFRVLFWDKSNIYINRAVAKYFDGDLKGALKDYDLALETSEKVAKNAQFYYNRGACKFDLNDIEGAKEDYQKAITLNPDAKYIFYRNN